MRALVQQVTITVRIPARLKREVVRSSARRGYTLTGFVVRALEDALAGDPYGARRLVGRGEIALYAKGKASNGAKRPTKEKTA